MLASVQILSGLVISALLILALLIFMKKQTRQTNLKKSFVFTLFCLLICTSGLISQILLSKPLNISPIYFDYFVYIGTCFLPVAFLIMSLKFTKPASGVNTKKFALSLSIIPILCLIGLWTNDFHHLFYIKYSIFLSEGVYGPLFYITSLYTYSLFGIALIYLAIYSIKNIKYYFWQSLFIFIGALVPIVVNLLGVVGIFNLSIYITPMCFSITILCFALSIFKFGFLKITPIALKKIVNRISDSYIVINSDINVIDFNEPLLKTFKLSADEIMGKSLFEIDRFSKNVPTSVKKKVEHAIQKTKSDDSTIIIDEFFESLDKYFHIEINRITEGNNFLGTLLLFKDVTQHKHDLQTIKNNQEILIERERLATLGQMIGGIAHNLKTPIMSISGAAEGLTDLIKEYDESIGDPDVTNDDHHAIANDMRDWITKIHSYTSYMSDIITAVKGQAVNLSENESDVFTIDEMIKRVTILMKHEIRNASLTLNTQINIPSTTTLHGDVNSLVQVVNNLITNAIQSYNGKKDDTINLSVNTDENNVVISVADHGCGMTKEVQNKLFKSMITTKGKNGTGLGMFMSYSTIKGHFNGDITFETEVNKGTTFNIILPLK